MFAKRIGFYAGNVRIRNDKQCLLRISQNALLIEKERFFQVCGSFRLLRLGFRLRNSHILATTILERRNVADKGGGGGCIRGNQSIVQTANTVDSRIGNHSGLQFGVCNLISRAHEVGNICQLTCAFFCCIHVIFIHTGRTGLCNNSLVKNKKFIKGVVKFLILHVVTPHTKQERLAVNFKRFLDISKTLRIPFLITKKKFIRGEFVEDGEPCSETDFLRVVCRGNGISSNTGLIVDISGIVVAVTVTTHRPCMNLQSTVQRFSKTCGHHTRVRGHLLVAIRVVQGAACNRRSLVVEGTVVPGV